jgi:hypothetical protein
VANNEDAGTGVGSPNISRVDPKGTRSISKHVQVSSHRGQPLFDGRACNIFDDDEEGLKVADDARVFLPESRPLTFDATTSSARSVADVLTRKSSTQNVDGLELMSLTDIYVPPHIRPVLREHSTPSRINLNLPHHTA